MNLPLERSSARLAVELPQFRAKEGEVSCTGHQCANCMCFRHTRVYKHTFLFQIEPCYFAGSRAAEDSSTASCFSTPEKQLKVAEGFKHRELVRDAVEARKAMRKLFHALKMTTATNGGPTGRQVKPHYQQKSDLGRWAC